MTKLKYNKHHIYSTSNTLKVTVNQTSNTIRVGVDGVTICLGAWDTSERDLLLEVIKREHYAHLAYRELYYDLLQRLASIGLVQDSEGEGSDRR